MAVGIDVVVALVGVLLALVSQKPLHRIEEGSVGVYWRGGRLLNVTSAPGYHLQLPILTKHSNVQVSFKTSVVHDVPCGTASGVLVRFHQVEVVHRLRPTFVLDTVRNYSTRFEKLWINDLMYHETNLICSKHTLHQVYISHFDQLDELLQARMSAILAQWAPGLEIISIRLTKPNLPMALRDTYELVDQEKAKLLLATQAQHNVLKQADTDLRQAVLASEKAAALSIIHMEKLYETALATQNISRIQDLMTVNRAKEMADATFYKTNLETKSFLAKLTPAYLDYLRATAGQTNTRYYFGSSIPHGFVDSAADVVAGGGADANALPATPQRDGS